MIAFETLDGVLTLGKTLFDGQTGSALERQKIPETLVESSRSWNRLGRVGQQSDNGCFAGGDRFYNRLFPGVERDREAGRPDSPGHAGEVCSSGPTRSTCSHLGTANQSLVVTLNSVTCDNFLPAWKCIDGVLDLRIQGSESATYFFVHLSCI